MQRTFIILPEFDKNWKSMGLSDEDLRRLENLILQDPEAGALMQGTGGLRKLRFAFENRGKSGCGRVGLAEEVQQFLRGGLRGGLQDGANSG